jgi:hypothetical protein
MFWFIGAVVLAVGLFGLAWWSSGRAKPGGISHHQAGSRELYQAMRDSQRGSDGVG